MPRPAKPWFRMYADLVGNQKVWALPDRLVRPWLVLLGLACNNVPRGRLPASERIAFALRMKEEKALSVIASLTTAGLIDKEAEHYVMHDWDDWQRDSDTRETPGRTAADERTSWSADRRNDTPESPLLRGDSAAITPLLRGDSAAVARHREEKSREDQKREEPEGDQDQIIVPVVRAFERCFGRLLSPMEIEQIKALDEEHPRERIDYALREASELAKRSVRYVQRICENQAVNGDNHDAGRPVGKGRADPSGTTAEERATIERLGIGKREFIVD